MSIDRAPAPTDRVPALIDRLRVLLEDISGVDLIEADPQTPFVELGLDSLALTQAALQVRKEFRTELTFRQLMESYQTLDSLARYLDENLSADPAKPPAGPVIDGRTPLKAWWRYRARPEWISRECRDRVLT